MSILSWWSVRRAASRKLKANLALNSDQEIIAANVPELVGKDNVAGMAYVLGQMDKWNEHATPEQALELHGRLEASVASWNADGNTMPYWGSLWVLRNYQRELGIEVPAVAPPLHS